MTKTMEKTTEKEWEGPQMRHSLEESALGPMKVILRQEERIDVLTDQMEKARWLLKKWLRDIKECDLDVVSETISFLKG